MGVYINMEMPKSCGQCKLKTVVGLGKEKCLVSGVEFYSWDTGWGDEQRRHESCPLAPVQPHYDLIDHNALKIAVMNCDCETRVDFLKHTMDCINKAPVVIPSDMPTYEGEEGE